MSPKVCRLAELECSVEASGVCAFSYGGSYSVISNKYESVFPKFKVRKPYKLTFNDVTGGVGVCGW